MSEALSLMAAELCFIEVGLQLIRAIQELQHVFIRLGHRHVIYKIFFVFVYIYLILI